MKLIINNNPEIIDAETLTVAELLTLKHFTFKMIVVKINGKPIDKNEYATTFLKEGDNVQAIHLISGG